MTILLRLEKPRLELTVCGMVSQQWLDGLLSGAIGQSQGGLTEGQMMWRGIHRDAQPDAAGVAAPSATPTPTPTPRQPRRRRSGSPADQFDLVDTGEL